MSDLSTSDSDHGERRKVSRRRFLGGVGAGAAGAAALGPASAIAAVVEDPAPLATTPTRFGRLFQRPSFAEATPRVIAALNDLGRPGGLLDARDALERGPIDLILDPALSVNNRDNPFHTAGTTFFGQFLDHDMTFDTTSRLSVPTPPENSPNTRTPFLDLDSVYGGGPVASPNLYAADRIRLRIESGGRFEDLARTASGQAIIPDPRNDENLIIAGLQAAFILFHNRVVDRLQAEGVPAAQLFTQARQLVTWHYHWIIVNEFLPQIISRPIVQQIFQQGRQFYRPAFGQQFIPVEFQGACYRFGHSMVRPSYRANLAGNPDGTAFFGFIFDPSQEGVRDPADLRGGARSPRRFIGWQTFFNFGDGQVRPNKRIDNKISTPLFNLPLGAIASGDPPTSLPQRNLQRHLTWSIPSGQELARVMRTPLLDAGNFPELRQFGVGLESNTPLWYYAMKEAQIVNDGIHLGPVGGKIVGEVFIGLLQLDPNSYVRTQPNWRPTLPSRSAGTFTMVDLLTFARVDPASRGQ
jgi:hypothetical protein